MIYRILRKGEVRAGEQNVLSLNINSKRVMRCVSHQFALLNAEEEAVSPHLQKVAALADVLIHGEDNLISPVAE
ncbi:hypothetical protein DMI62_21520 [Escherichia coli]|nr:hypothetical protein [Escherichia coli]